MLTDELQEKFFAHFAHAYCRCPSPTLLLFMRCGAWCEVNMGKVTWLHLPLKMCSQVNTLALKGCFQSLVV